MQEQSDAISAALGKIYLDKWYKIVMVFGYGTFLLTGAGLLPLFDTSATAFISLGAALIGMGEFINHPFQTVLTYGGKLTGHPRNPRFFGALSDVVGGCLVLFGCYRLVMIL